MSDNDRDPYVARMVAAQPVPDHGPDFWRSLEERMAADDGESDVVTPRATARIRRVALAAAALVLVVGAVAVRQLGDDKSPVVADDSSATTTIAPSADASRAINTVEDFIDALGSGDITAAALLLGPRSEEYLVATTGSVDAFLREAETGYGAWASSTDRQLSAVAVRGPASSSSLSRALIPVRGSPKSRADAFPVRHAESADAWFVEPWAFDPDTGGRIELVAPDPSAATPVLAAGAAVEVASAVPGQMWFGFDDNHLEEVVPPAADRGSNVTWNPTKRPAGRHTLLVVYETEKTFTALARIIEVRTK